MISLLEGFVSEKNLEGVVLLVNGVGYGVSVTIDDFSQLKTGETARLYIREQIRENSYDLFGFLNTSTRNLFDKLIDVNGVGPKMALSILNLGSVEQVKAAITDGNVRYLQTASGVGKRLAERIIVDLKDKLDLLGSASIDKLLADTGNSKVSDEALAGLVALGYSVNEASRSLEEVDPNLPVEERIKAALKNF